MADKRKFWHRADINRMLEICLNSADLVDEWGYEKNPAERDVTDALGLGYRALSGNLRKGVKAVIDLQAEYRGALEMRDYAEDSEKDARDFLEDVFGDRDIDSLREEDKKRFRDLYRQIEAEWEKEEEDS